MNNYSVWFNKNGIDECYGKVEGNSIKEVFNKLKEIVDFIECDINEFELECKGKGWKMYSFDGIGILEVKEGYNVDNCKEDYNEKCELF